MQSALQDAARIGGHRWFHIRDPRRQSGTRGLPDLLTVKNGRIYALELKTAKGKVSADQQAWLDELAAVPGVTAEVVRPDTLEAWIQRLSSGD